MCEPLKPPLIDVKGYVQPAPQVVIRRCPIQNRREEDVLYDFVRHMYSMLT